MNGRPEEITTIRLRRGPCFGFCPIYEVILQADGRATWNGERFVDRLGPYEGEISPGDFGHVAAFVERAGFFSWNDEYLGGVFDTPEYQLTVARGRQSKTVRQNGVDEPPDFWVIAALVDGLAATVDWKPAAGPDAGESAMETSLSSYGQLPPPESCRLIDFQQARVITLRTFPPRHILTVTGTKPWLHMSVDLVPRRYVRQPEYWGIEVVGCLSGFGPPVMTPFSVSLELEGTVGTRGIEVIGATRSQTIEIPSTRPVPSDWECFDWHAFHDHQPPGPPRLTVFGTCQFPRSGYTAELRRAEPQGINPADLILDLVVEEPEAGAHVITELEVRYQEETDVEYETVTIRPGPTIPVEDVF
jgi:hypothetical protein